MFGQNQRTHFTVSEYTFSDLIYPFVMIEDLDWSCLLLVQPTQTYFYHISINQTIKIGPVITMVGLNLDEFMFMELSSKEMHSKYELNDQQQKIS